MGVQGAVGHPGQAFGDEPLPLLVLDLRVLAGMSGAPLFDRSGRLVGMLVKKSGEFSLAVPVAQLRRAVDVARGGPPRQPAGLVLEDGLEDGLPCARVGKVVPASPAARAGLRRGDVILEVDGRRVMGSAAAAAALDALPPGAPARLATQDTTVTLHFA